MIATNMAGRGTDIKLGKDLDLTQPEAGLQIIGTERHESRRIDRQLRGRSGRQGDPGAVDLLPLAGRRPDAALRLRPDRPVDGQERGRGRRGHHRRSGHPGHRAGAEAGRAAELPAAEAAARVRRRDEPAAGGDLLAAALRAGAGRGAEGRGPPDDRAARWSGRSTSSWPAPSDPEEYDRGGLREALTLQYLVTVDAAHRCRGHADHRRDGRGGQGGRRGDLPAQDRVPGAISGRRSAFPRWTARCCPRSCCRCWTSGGRITSTISTSCGTPSSTAPGARRIRWWSTSGRPSRCSRT